MGVQAKSLTMEEVEDIGIAIFMRETDRTEYSKGKR